MNISQSARVEEFAQRVYRITDPLSGQSMPMPLERIQLTPWAYSLTFTNLAQAAVQTQVFNIQANSDFILTEVALTPNLGAVGLTVRTVPVPFIRLLLTDSGTNEQLMAQPIDVNVYCTIPTMPPRTLDYYRLLTGKSSLTAQVSNFAPAAETYTFDLILRGVNVRIYG